MKQLIRFTPVGSYAFSGDSSLSNKGEDEVRRASYIVDSEYLPPQTTVLGTLRRALLEWAGIFHGNAIYTPDEQANIDQLIGTKGFRFSNEPVFDAGIIRSISCVFMTRIKDGQSEWLFPVPQNVKLKESTCQFMPWDADSSMNGMPGLNGYNVKDGLRNAFVVIPAPETISEAGVEALIQDIQGKSCVDASSIFHKEVQTAIRQAENDDDKGFRMHHRVYLPDSSYAFAVIADLDDAMPLPDLSRKLLVSMGARNSLFRVEATPLGTSAGQIQAPADGQYGCIATLSPLLLPENWREQVAFAIVNRQKVRQMIRKAVPGIAYGHDDTLRYFAAPGSVLYIKPACVHAFCAALNAQTALRQAGFSHYIILNEGVIK